MKLILGSVFLADVAASSLQLQVDDDGGFQLFGLSEEHGKVSWTRSAGQPRVHSNGGWLNLVLADRLREEVEGSKEFRYRDADTGKDVLSVKYTTFKDDPHFVLFEQCLLSDLKNTAVDPNISVAKEMLMSAAPRFAVEPEDSRGFFAYYDQMVGGMANGTKHGRWGVDGIPSGTMAGPVVAFQPQRQGAIAIAPASSFMSQNGCHDRALQALEFGLMGSITEVPKGTCWSVAVASGSTPTDAVNALGSRLLARHGKKPFSGDTSLDKLSYSTDNGAFYYYNAAPFANPQEALEKVLLESDPALPVGSVLLDSWWYYKGTNGGVTTWAATPDAFPDGLAEFQRRTKLPIVAHNRYWSSETPYATANGGQYDFLIEQQKGKAIPLEQRFWDDLLANATEEWGLAVYEQDWLHNEWEGLDATLQNVSLAETWLQQMGLGASRAGIKIQYCMAYTRHALASVAIPAVDQIRVSDDYQVDLTQSRPNANLYVGTSSLLAAALGLAPSKDVFWSTSVQPGNEKKYGNATEPHPELEGLVSLLTAGPVAIGDRFNYTNVSLVRMLTTADGTLLKPSWPAIPVDEYHTQRALGAGGPDGELTYSRSKVTSGNAQRTWINLLAVDMKAAYSFDVNQSLPELLLDCEGCTLASAKLPLTAASTFRVMKSELEISACGKDDYQHYLVATILPEPCFTLLGEVGKFVPVSPARFTKIETCGSLSVEAAGSPGERIEVLYAKPGKGRLEIFSAACVVPGGQRSCHIQAHNHLVV